MPSGYPIPKDRKCVTCGSPRTYIRPDGQQVWHKNPDGGYDCMKCYRRSNRGRKYSREYAKKWRKENHDYYRDYQNCYAAGWYEENPEKRHMYYMRNYYLKNGRKRVSEYQKKNKDKISEYKKRHRKENIELYRERDRKKYLRRKKREQYKKSRKID